MPKKVSSLGLAPDPMTWRKAAPIFIVGGIFDLLRMMCEQLWFFGPAIIAAYCAAKVGDSALNVGGVLTKACVVGATAAGAYGLPIIEALGAVLGIAVGFLGWLVVGLMLVMTNRRLFKENAMNIVWLVASLFISEVPLVGTLPALTGMLFKLYRVQIRKDRVALAVHKKQVKEEQVRLRQEQAAGLMRIQAAQTAEVQGEQYAEEERRRESEDDERYGEIPAGERLAA
jgi:hypothetical protein